VKDYFSGTDQMGAIDVVLFNDIQNVIQMYSVSGQINAKHANINAWVSRMLANQTIKLRHDEMLAILQAKDLKKDYISWLIFNQ